MKIRSLAIANFKAIDQVYLDDLQDVIVIAGPNGCGKSTIFDAIRFWKTTIGTYQRDEMRHWLNDLGLSERQDAMLYAHQNKDEPFSVRATIEISAREKSYMGEHAEGLLAYYFYKQSGKGSPMAPETLTLDNLDLIDDFRARKTQIMQQVSNAMSGIHDIPDNNFLTGTVEVNTKGSVRVSASISLQLILSIFVPEQIGIIDYYGPQRTFTRENVNNLNLQVDQQRDVNRISSALYNQANKYSNVKSELASSYVRRIIRERAGETDLTRNDLEESIRELFTLFIPGKIFEGIQPTKEGVLTFNVRTKAGLHDIGDLSSGEKELIYGYLRIRSSGLSQSVILIDEPELHLNPRLTDGLPDFYYRHIGRPADNQLWLVTHSDNILRQSVDIDGFDVFHMQTVGTYDDATPQMIKVSARGDLDRAIIDLVGDLAAYRPGGKLVILEGGGDPEFDLEFVSRLFPEFAQRVNLVSSGSKKRVRALHDVLKRFGQSGGLFTGVYSIIDSDGSAKGDYSDDGKYQWPRYHIENYLLEPRFIRQVLVDHFILKSDASDAEVIALLKTAAASTKDALLRHAVEQFARTTLMQDLRLDTPRDQAFDPTEVGARVQLSLDRMVERSRSTLTAEALTRKTSELSTQLDAALAGDDWVKQFRGRDVLKALAGIINKPSLNYDGLRNQILGKMRMERFQPNDVAAILLRIEPALCSSIHCDASGENSRTY